MNQQTIFWCHGGCFGGGNPSYDQSVRNYLTQNGYNVVPVTFSTTNWQHALEDIMDTCVNSNANYILAGVSSGGLLAHIVANQLNRPAFLLCPVIKPALRHSNLEPEQQKLQLRFFRNLEEMKYVENNVQSPNNRRQIIAGRQDTKAPITAFLDWFTRPNHQTGSCCHLLEGGHELCQNPPLRKVLQSVQSLFSN